MPQLGYQPRRVSRGPADLGAAFQHHYILPSNLGEMIRNAAPDDAGPNDHNPCMFWKLISHHSAE